jgi:hypothetical protein
MSEQIEKTKIEKVLNYLATDFFFEEFCDKGWDFSEKSVIEATKSTVLDGSVIPNKIEKGLLLIKPKKTPKGRGDISLHVSYLICEGEELSHYDLKVKAFKGGKQSGEFYLPKP